MKRNQEGVAMFTIVTVVFFIAVSVLLAVVFVQNARKSVAEELAYQEQLVLQNNIRLAGKEAKESVTDTAGWQTYRNDVLGISFSYPAAWGDAEVEPSNNITDLKLFVQKDAPTDGGNLYYGLLRIGFKKNEAVEVGMYNV